MSMVVIISKDVQACAKVKRAMELASLNPVVTNSPFLATQIIATSDVDLVVCDQAINAGRGIAISMQIRESFVDRTPPILIMDEASNSATMAAAMCAGATGVFAKSDAVEDTVSLARALTNREPEHHYARIIDRYSKKRTRDRDALTGLPKRAFFDRRFKAEWAYARHNETPVSIMMITPDGMQSLKSQYNNDQIVQMLTQTAKVIEGTLRSRDCAAIYDEGLFSVVLAETGNSGAVSRAREISGVLGSMNFGDVDNPLKVTFSVGVAGTNDTASSSPGKLLSKARKRVNSAARSGGNKVVGKSLWAA